MEHHVTDDELLDRHVLMADFVATCFGDNVEVAVHDIRDDLDHSIKAIFNNHVSGRQPGAPMTQLGRRFLKEKRTEGANSVCNYEGVTANGVSVRASTFFIKNPDGRVIGYLCVNIDVSAYSEAAKVLDKLLHYGQASPVTGDAIVDDRVSMVEDFPRGLTEIIGQVIAKYSRSAGKKLDSFVARDRIAVIAALEEKDLFSYKGCIGEAAGVLGISEPTVYRYLQKIRKEK